MANFEIWQKADLKKPLQVQALHGVVFSADNMANLFGVEVLDDGAAASLTGSVTGYAIRADGATLTVTGTLAGNKASITLPASAYVVTGPLDIVVKVTGGGATTTVGAWRAYVQRSTTDSIIDPGHVIPSLEELLALIEPMEQGTAAANAAAQAANTAASNANTKANAANTAANTANTAAGKIDNMTVAATTGNAGTSAQAVISEVSGHKQR